LIGFLAFTIFPILASLYYSFMNYDILRPPRFIGLQNYIRLFTNDEIFHTVIGNSLYLVFIGVPLAMITAYVLAALLNNEMSGRVFYRTIFFIPVLVPEIASAEVWRWVYNTNYGVINSTLKAMGLPVIPFLSSTVLAKPSLILINMWATGVAIMIFLAALQDVPRSLYDAAIVDGANFLQRFIHVTVPMTTPAILFVLITSVIGTFQYFTLAWLMTQGGPNQSTEFYAMYLYRSAFEYFKMGYASAQAWILFVIIVVLMIFIFRSSARWVYYGGESQ
jgi:multiple sugar transport system permease protein